MINVNLKDIKVGNGTNSGVSSKDLTWDVVDAGTYPATMVIVYPWKSLTRDTNVRIKDENGRYVKDNNGKFITEFTKDVTWFNTDVVFKINGGEFDNHAVKMSLSTHPNMVGSAKQFLYRMGLLNVSLDDLKDHIGANGIIEVKTKDETFVDKTTGLEKTITKSYVSYVHEADTIADDLGI